MALYILLHQCQVARGMSLCLKVHVHPCHAFAKLSPDGPDRESSYSCILSFRTCMVNGTVVLGIVLLSQRAVRKFRLKSSS